MTPTALDPTGGTTGPLYESSGFSGPAEFVPLPGSPQLSPTIRGEPGEDRGRVIVGILIGAVVLLSLTVILMAVGLRNGAAGAEPCISAPSLGPAAPSGAGEPHLPTPAGLSQPPPVVATPDELNYLKFLQGIDQRRVALQAAVPATPAAAPATPVPASPAAPAEPAAPATPSAPAAPAVPADPAASTEANNVSQWQQLITDFQGQAAPDRYSVLAADYLTLLDNSMLAAQYSTSRSPADDATRADAELARLCTLTHIDKSFNITFPGSTSQ
ncbi:MAG: hypothetical protein ACLQVD_00240 [Capsulimonadaceae bacterium]